LHAGGGAYWAEGVVRHHLNVMRLSQRRDLFRVRQPARQTDIRADELHRAARQQRLELPDSVQPLARRDGDVDVLRQQGHLIHAVRQDRVLVEVGMIGLDAARQHNGLARRQTAMDLNAEVDVITDGLAVPGHGLDGVAHFVGVRPEVGHLTGFVEERRQMTNRREAACFSVQTTLHQFVGGLPEDVIVDAGLVARLAAQQLVTGHAKMLAGDIPQGDVDSTQSAHDGRPTKVRPPVQVLPVVFDA